MNFLYIIKVFFFLMVLNCGYELKAMVIKNIVNQTEQDITVEFHDNKSSATSKALLCASQKTTPYNRYLFKNEKITTLISSDATCYITVEYKGTTTAFACGTLYYKELKLCALWQQNTITNPLKKISRLSDYIENLACNLIIQANGNLAIRPAN